jgi:hypothetical protein
MAEEDVKVAPRLFTDHEYDTIIKASRSAGLEAYRGYVARVMRNAPGTRDRGYAIGQAVAEAILPRVEKLCAARLPEGGEELVTETVTEVEVDRDWSTIHEEGVRFGLRMAIEAASQMDGRAGRNKIMAAIQDLLDERMNDTTTDNTDAETMTEDNDG